MKISLEEAEYLFSEEDGDEYKFIEQGDWEDEGKYQSAYTVCEKDGKYYMFWVSRSGSYFSHYELEYNEDKEGNVELVEVIKKSRTIESWEPL